MEFKKTPFEQNTLTELTPEQIEAAKRVYGDIYLIKVEDKKMYLHKPDRRVIDLAHASMRQRQSLFDETIMTNCWLAGDKEIITETELFYGAAAQLNQIMQAATSELVKL